MEQPPNAVCIQFMKGSCLVFIVYSYIVTCGRRIKKKNKDKMNLKINEEYVKQISILEMIIIYKRMCCSTSHI